MKILKQKFLNSLEDSLGKASSARISSYIILASILLNSLVFIFIELKNASVMWKQDLTYTIPSEHIWIFGLILSHHLGLLFYKTREFKGENNFLKEQIDKFKKDENKG